MNLIAKTLHGSRLYGLDNPTSDYDFKSIHLPPLKDCLLLRASRNVREEVFENGVKTERESFALQEFLSLAARGEDVAITMLHVGESAIFHDSTTFQMLRANRKRFYTKHMSGCAGYCRGMAAKYALRADRMDTVEKVIKVLERMIAKGVAKLAQAWDELPELPHTAKGENPLDRNVDKRVYTVTGKGLPAPIAPAYALGILEKVRDSYGERVKSAKQMGHQDLKAVSHSFRVGYQLKHQYIDGDFSFPLPESDFIRAVKEGKLNYVTDRLDDKLNELITEVEKLAEKSNYPDKVDAAWMDDIVLKAYDQ